MDSNEEGKSITSIRKQHQDPSNDSDSGGGSWRGSRSSLEGCGSISKSNLKKKINKRRKKSTRKKEKVLLSESTKCKNTNSVDRRNSGSSNDVNWEEGKICHYTTVEETILPLPNFPLGDPDQISTRRVSFPELGADILHGKYFVFFTPRVLLY